MRQGQQHRRGRGRNNNSNNNSHNQNYSHNNNHRKGNNPLSRSFESNGPEVKVRGTPAHVAEKYLSLARDAQSSGDPVLAENYLQHAEHYNRIILAYREQQVQSGEMNGGGGGPRTRSDGMDGDESSDDQGDDMGQGDQPPMPRHQQDQPRFQDQQRNDDGRQQQHREHRSNDQGRFRDRNDRNDRQQDRQPQETRQPQEARQPQDRAVEQPQPSIDSTPPPPRADNPGRRRERFGPGNEQPEFLRRPVRRPRREAGNGDSDAVVEVERDEGSQDKTPV